MINKYLSILLAVVLSGCATMNNDVGGTFFPDGSGEWYDYIGRDELSGSEIWRLQDGNEYLYDHRAILVTFPSGEYKDAREVVKVLNDIEYEELIEKIEAEKAAEEAKYKKMLETDRLERQRQEELQAVERTRQKEIRAAEHTRQKEIRAAERERQRAILFAEQKRTAELRRQKIINMEPVVCDNMISALNANEVRAIRQYPLNQEYRVIGIAKDINVTFGDAIVRIKSDVDSFNSCSAEMTSFDDAEVLNIGERIDLFCSSWQEVAGSVHFKKCRPYRKVILNDIYKN